MQTQGIDRLVWLDMEMTGLDPESCVPLQVGIVITKADLTELDHIETTIWQPESVLERIEPFVRRMHTENGLLDAVRRSENSLMNAERMMMKLASMWCAFGTGVIAGNSIHVDRMFLRKYFPTFDGFMHYRMVDVSSVKEIARRWYGESALYTKGQGRHTALSDIRESIEELKHYRTRVFQPSLVGLK